MELYRVEAMRKEEAKLIQLYKKWLGGKQGAFFLEMVKSQLYSFFLTFFGAGGNFIQLLGQLPHCFLSTVYIEF